MKKKLMIFGLAALLLAGCENKDKKAAYEEQQRTKAIIEYVQKNGYAVGPVETPSDEFLIGFENIPEISFKTTEGDSLESLAKLLYNDNTEWDAVQTTNWEILRKYKPEDNLPVGIKIGAYMLQPLIDKFTKGYPQREIKKIE